MNKEELVIFEDDSFDPVSYINQKFPTEQSLEGIDDEIKRVEAQLESIEKEMLLDIREHAEQNKKSKEQLVEAKILAGTIIKEVKEIQLKAR